jgi:hypothetical protein
MDPATQEWKRKRLADAAIPVPTALTFAESLLATLVAFLMGSDAGLY